MFIKFSLSSKLCVAQQDITIFSEPGNQNKVVIIREAIKANALLGLKSFVS